MYICQNFNIIYYACIAISDITKIVNWRKVVISCQIAGHFEWYLINSDNVFEIIYDKDTSKRVFSDFHDDVIKWKHFPRYWSFVRGIHRSPVNSPHKGQWRGALVFSLICTWINAWVNNREAGDLRRHHAHYDVMVMCNQLCACWWPHAVKWEAICCCSDKLGYGTDTQTGYRLTTTIFGSCVSRD